MTPWMWVPQRLFSGAFEKLRRATICFVKHVSPPVRLPAWNTSAPTGRIFMKFDIWRFPENLSKKFTFHENLTRITGTLHQDLCLLMIILAETSLDKTCRKNQNTFCFQQFCIRKSCYIWQYRKLLKSRRGHRQNTTANALCILDK